MKTTRYSFLRLGRPYQLIACAVTIWFFLFTNIACCDNLRPLAFEESDRGPKKIVRTFHWPSDDARYNTPGSGWEKRVLVLDEKEAERKIHPMIYAILNAYGIDDSIPGDDEQMKHVPISFVLSGSTVTDFVFSVIKNKPRFAAFNDFDVAILVQDNVEQRLIEMKEKEGLSDDDMNMHLYFYRNNMEQCLLKLCLAQGSQVQFDHTPGALQIVENPETHKKRFKYAIEDGLDCRLGMIFSISCFAVEKRGDSFVIYGRQEAFQDLENNVLRIMDEPTIGDYDEDIKKAAKLVIKWMVYEAALGFRLEEASKIKLWKFIGRFISDTKSRSAFEFELRNILTLSVSMGRFPYEPNNIFLAALPALTELEKVGKAAEDMRQRRSENETLSAI